MALTPNPMCACGCGNEVSRPTHKYILGHVVKSKLTKDDRKAIKKALAKNVSTYWLAKKFGVSQSFVSQMRYGYYRGDPGYISEHAAKPKRKEEIEICQMRGMMRRVQAVIRQAKARSTR